MATKQLPRISSQMRERIGSRYAARLRKQGKLPAVVYGHKQDPVHVTVDAKQVVDLLHRHAHLVEVDLGQQTEACLIKAVQWNHLSSEVIHLDLTRVDLTEEVEVEVEIELLGEAVGLKETGAILDQTLTELTVRCRADSIPERITHDVSELGVGEMVTVGDLKLPEGVEAVDDPETAVVQISVVEELPEPEELEPEGAAEPEVIGKAEKDEEQEADEKD